MTWTSCLDACGRFFLSALWIFAVVAIAFLAAPLAVAGAIWALKFVPIPAGTSIADQFNLVNAMIAGMAFAGVIVTLFMQRSELILQREELRQSREQYEKMAEAQVDSEKRLFLTAYLSAVSNYVDLSHDNPDLNMVSSFPEISGAIARRDLLRRLQGMFPVIDAELKRLYPTVAIRQFNSVSARLISITRDFQVLWDDFSGASAGAAEAKAAADRARPVVASLYRFVPPHVGEILREIDSALAAIQSWTLDGTRLANDSTFLEMLKIVLQNSLEAVRHLELSPPTSTDFLS